MRQTSELTYNELIKFDTLNKCILGTRIFPLVAPVEVDYPFCVYQVDRRPKYSKQGLFEYEVQIRLISEDYEKICDLEDLLSTHFNGLKEFVYQGTDSGINPEKPSEYVMTSTYSLFKNL